MKHAIPALFATAVLFSALPAQARVFEGGITHAEMQKLLTEAGFSAVTVEDANAEPGSVADLVVMGGPGRWYVQFMACKEDRCADVHLYAGFDTEKPLAKETVTEISQEMVGSLSGNVYLDSEGDPILQADINTDGVSGNNIRFQVRVFDVILRCLTVKIGFDDSADACEKIPDRLLALARQGVSAEDVSQVIVAIGPDRLDYILRESGFRPERKSGSNGLVSFFVQQDGVSWTALVSQKVDEQVTVFLTTVCPRCGADPRRANAYNSERRWLTAEARNGAIDASMTVPLAGGITESALGMMIRSFHSWAKSFPSDVPK